MTNAKTSKSWAHETALYIQTHRQLPDDWVKKTRKHLGVRKRPHKKTNPDETWLIHKRTTLGWSRTDLLKELAKFGCVYSVDAVMKWEHGERKPNDKTIRALSIIYGVKEVTVNHYLSMDLKPELKASFPVPDNKQRYFTKLLNEAFKVYDYNMPAFYRALQTHGCYSALSTVRKWLNGTNRVSNQSYPRATKALKAAIQAAERKQ